MVGVKDGSGVALARSCQGETENVKCDRPRNDPTSRDSVQQWPTGDMHSISSSASTLRHLSSRLRALSVAKAPLGLEDPQPWSPEVFGSDWMEMQNINAKHRDLLLHGQVDHGNRESRCLV